MKKNIRSLAALAVISSLAMASPITSNQAGLVRRQSTIQPYHLHYRQSGKQKAQWKLERRG